MIAVSTVRAIGALRRTEGLPLGTENSRTDERLGENGANAYPDDLVAMSPVPDIAWLDEFGLGGGPADGYIAGKAAINRGGRATSQAHVLRRAFDLLALDGVLCADNAPLVYFKRVAHLDARETASLHRTLWNHGGAPVLVLIAPEEVQLFSALLPPQPVELSDSVPGLVAALGRASVELRELVPSIESGEFFRKHPKSFNPEHRVDRRLLNNLEATRQKLVQLGNVDHAILDALLCRLVFACYLFDRGVIGENYLASADAPTSHLREVLAMQPPSKAKKHLYDLFRQLGRDFNGDLFSEDLTEESAAIPTSYLKTLSEFFAGDDVATGQAAFWPYDFGVIPIETISAIYERFLRDSARDEGAFYTPRFLAELVLDLALSKTPTLLGQQYLDPACGSGIFLVGLFNRLAEEWKQNNPTARNDRRARELREVLCSSLCGSDINPTACRITAFSLYLAYLDQLSPRDIDELRQKGHKLPTLVHYTDRRPRRPVEGNIWCGDFFSPDIGCTTRANVVVGNPPWGSRADGGTLAGKWCAANASTRPVPDKQIALAFAWKATEHLSDGGRVCFILPTGTIFNHSAAAREFQGAFFRAHAVDEVLNLADYQRFLFDEAENPAIVLVYQNAPPADAAHIVEYWAPKADWLVTRADIIVVTPEDRSRVTVGEILTDLRGPDAPQIWKQHYWASRRDGRLLQRLADLPRLRDLIRNGTRARWSIAEGFQPLGRSDDVTKAKHLQLPTRNFIDATSSAIDLFLLQSDCTQLPSSRVTLRSRSNSNVDVFKAPHVLISKGFTRAAFADFDVSFRHAVRGIAGPAADRELLMFLAAYLRSPLAAYFAFHTSSNWGISRSEVQVNELLRLPFPTPEDAASPEQAWRTVRDVASIVESAMHRSEEMFVDRPGLVAQAQLQIQSLIERYFDVMPSERPLIDDTVSLIIPSIRPVRHAISTPTLKPSNEGQRLRYADTLCGTLNSWARSASTVVGHTAASGRLGLGMAVLRKAPAEERRAVTPQSEHEVLKALERLRSSASSALNTIEIVRGVKVFDGDRLYIVKPLAQRFWTETAALNDADDVAATILNQQPTEVAW